jgi:hypothetical protein
MQAGLQASPRVIEYSSEKAADDLPVLIGKDLANRGFLHHQEKSGLIRTHVLRSRHDNPELFCSPSESCVPIQRLQLQQRAWSDNRTRFNVSTARRNRPG